VGVDEGRLRVLANMLCCSAMVCSKRGELRRVARGWGTVELSQRSLKRSMGSQQKAIGSPVWMSTGCQRAGFVQIGSRRGSSSHPLAALVLHEHPKVLEI